MLVPSNVKILKTQEKGKGLFAKKSIRKNQQILKISQNLSLRPHVKSSLNSIQIDDDTYIDVDKQDTWQYINHSCSPNSRIDLDSLSFVAINNISEDQEITFHYCTTEFDLAAKNEDFPCKCNSKNCLKRIKGFKHLTKNQKQSLTSILIPYTLRKLKLNSNKIEILPGTPKYGVTISKNNIIKPKVN